MGIEKRGKNSWRVGFQADDLPTRPWIRQTIKLSPSMSERMQRKEAEKILARMIADYEDGILKAPTKTKYTFAASPSCG